MPTLILPDGTSRWIPFSAHKSFIKDLSSFYDKFTSSLDDTWADKVLRLQDGGVEMRDIESVERYLVESFDTSAMFTKYGRLMRGILIDASLATWQAHVQAYSSVPDSIVVPPILDGIAQLYHNERSGRTGKGEFLIPILFKDAVWNSHEAIYDVDINGRPWHVKAIKRFYEPSKLNRCGYANGPICKELSRFMSASQLSAGFKSTGFLANYDQIRELSQFAGIDDKRDVIRAFQSWIDEEMRELSIDEAEGIIFYLEPERRFVFRKKDEVYCTGATQSNHQVSVLPNFFLNAYNKIERQRERAEEREAAKQARIVAKLARQRAKEREVAARMARKLAKQHKKEQYAIDQANAKDFLLVIRAAWLYAKKRKARPDPSFHQTLADFVQERSLDYQYFYTFLMNNSSCMKTFQKLQSKCN